MTFHRYAYIDSPQLSVQLRAVILQSSGVALAGKKKNPKISRVEPVTTTIRMRQHRDMGIP